MCLTILFKRLPFAAAGAIALALLSAPPLQAAPATLGTVIGAALLCRSHLDNHYFHAWLTAAYGPAYKHEGGAYWFKADGNLWGAQVAEIWVSDDTSELVFVGAITETMPEELGKAIRAAAGVQFEPADPSAFPLRVSREGSSIVYLANKSKIFCAKYKPIPVGTAAR